MTMDVLHDAEATVGAVDLRSCFTMCVLLTSFQGWQMGQVRVRVRVRVLMLVLVLVRVLDPVALALTWVAPVVKED